MLKLKLQLWPPDVKNWLLGKDLDAGKDLRQEEKETSEDEMIGWHHWLEGHELEQALGVGDGQGSLACCSPWGCKESDWAIELNWPEGSAFCRSATWGQQSSWPSVRMNLRSCWMAWKTLGWLWSGLPSPKSLGGCQLSREVRTKNRCPSWSSVLSAGAGLPAAAGCCMATRGHSSPGSQSRNGWRGFTPPPPLSSKIQGSQVPHPLFISQHHTPIAMVPWGQRRRTEVEYSDKI